MKIYPTKKLTNEIVNERVTKHNIVCLENYVNTHTPIKWKCLLDSHEWTSAPTEIFTNINENKVSCSVCRTRNIFIDRINNFLAEHNIKSKEDILDVNKSIQFYCQNNHEWEDIPKHIIDTVGCPYCNHVYLNNDIIDEQLIGRNIKRVDDFATTDSKIKWQCLIDGYEWETCPKAILNGCQTGCPRCAKHEPVSNEAMDELLKGTPTKRIGDIIHSNKKVKWRCEIDGHEWESTPMSIKVSMKNNNYGCYICQQRKTAEKLRFTNEDIDEKMSGTKIKRIGNYISSDTKIEWECLETECGHHWFSAYNNISQGSGCPECAIGKGERRCGELIKEHVKYDFIQPNKKAFYFNDEEYFPDFYLEIGSNKIFIEYNGQQHYWPVCFGGISQERAEENFIKQQKRDESLRNHCKKNNIILIEIKYDETEENVINRLIKLNELVTPLII